MDWEGVAVKMLEVGWWGWGSLRDLSKNISKQGVGKGKSCLQGGGLLKVPCPLPKILIIDLNCLPPLLAVCILKQVRTRLTILTGSKNTHKIKIAETL